MEKPRETISEIARGETPADAIIADTAHGADAYDLDPSLQKLAELALHRQTQTPLTIGLLGPAGSGKSFALNRLLDLIASLARAAGSASRTPFLKKLVAIKIDAARFGRDTANGIASALHEGLARSHPALAAEALLAARDPRIALREASELLAQARRHLEAERRTLEEADSRRATLTETILYDTPSSLLENYIRRRRGTIERSLSRFGINGDVLRAFKDMVRSASETSGPGAKLTSVLNAFWSYQGQSGRLIAAFLFLLLGIGIGAAIDHQAFWLGGLRVDQTSASVARWLESRMSWFGFARQIAFAAAGLYLILNLWHGWRYLTLVGEGRRLLQQDLAERRQDIDQFLAHQTHQVDRLVAEVEALSRRVSEAEKRAGLRHHNAVETESAPFSDQQATARASAFFRAVGQILDASQAHPSAPDTPERILFIIDHFDCLPPAEARESLALLRHFLSPHFLLIAAFDPHVLGDDAENQLDRLVQIPFQLSAATPSIDFAQFVQGLATTSKAPSSARPVTALPGVDATQSALDAPLSDAEVAKLAALAPLAGGTPRVVKRFVNLYRLLRGGPSDGALALLLAAEAGGTAEELQALTLALSSTVPENTAFDLPGASPRLRRALLAAREGETSLTLAAARQAAQTAHIFSLRAQ